MDVLFSWRRPCHCAAGREPQQCPGLQLGAAGVCKARGVREGTSTAGIPMGEKVCTLLRGLAPLRVSKGSGWHLLAGVLKRSNIDVGKVARSGLTRRNCGFVSL